MDSILSTQNRYRIKVEKNHIDLTLCKNCFFFFVRFLFCVRKVDINPLKFKRIIYKAL